MDEETATASSRSTVETQPIDPFYAQVTAYDVELLASYTGLSCRLFVDNGLQYVAVSMQGWAPDKFATLDGNLWHWLGTNERRAAFARFAVLVPTEEARRLRVWTGVILWD